MTSTLDKPVRRVIELLIKKEYDEIVRLTGGERLDAESIQSALDGYGRTFVLPPESAFENLDVVQVVNASPPRWSVRMNLWTTEEGRSDLSIELTVTQSDDDYVIELDDIQVL